MSTYDNKGDVDERKGQEIGSPSMTGMNRIIDIMYGKLEERRNHAKHWLNQHKSGGTSRNKKAADAAQDHVNRAVEVKGLLLSNAGPYVILEALRAHKDHAEREERAFRKKIWEAVSKHKYGYARFIHEAAAETYEQAIHDIHEQLAALDVHPSERAKWQYSMVMACNGLKCGGEAGLEIDVREGIETSHDLSQHVMHRVVASARAGMALPMVNAEASVNAGSARSVEHMQGIKTQRVAIVKKQLKLDCKGPFYVYQGACDVRLNNGDMVTVYASGLYIYSEPLP